MNEYFVSFDFSIVREEIRGGSGSSGGFVMGSGVGSVGSGRGFLASGNIYATIVDAENGKLAVEYARKELMERYDNAAEINLKGIKKL